MCSTTPARSSARLRRGAGDLDARPGPARREPGAGGAQPARRRRALTTCPECSAIRTSGQPCPACGWRPQPKPRHFDVIDGDLAHVERDGQMRGADAATRRSSTGSCSGSRASGATSPAGRRTSSRRSSGTGRRADNAAPEPPEPATRSWVRSRQIAYAKARERVMNTIERATGRWREILPQLGIETRFLVNRHGPCPLCGGKDRFRCDDRDGSGSYYCNQCGPGPGIMLDPQAARLGSRDRLPGDRRDHRPRSAAAARAAANLRRRRAIRPGTAARRGARSPRSSSGISRAAA